MNIQKQLVKFMLADYSSLISACQLSWFYSA